MKVITESDRDNDNRDGSDVTDTVYEVRSIMTALAQIFGSHPFCISTAPFFFSEQKAQSESRENQK